MRALAAAASTLVALAILAGCGEDAEGERQVEIPIKVSEPEVERVVEGVVDGDPAPEANCAAPTNCAISYEVDALVGFDTDRELLDKQRRVWEALFSDPRFEDGTITLRGPVTTAGGKERISEILRVSCTRSAAKQIDWGAVEPEGFKSLCEWDELVRF